jgi:phosphopantothenoylcysteine decarboxylase/phosphopantothenate--cysteine ligase
MTESSPPRRVLVTAGPTHEPLDAVRYLANRSSGRMGLALAVESARRGHRTTLALGPTPLATPEHSHLRCERFRTAADLQALLAAAWPAHDVLLMAAAVADYRPARTDPGKLRREPGRSLVLELEPVPDLVAGLAAGSRPDQLIVAFALEPADGLEATARAKLAAKGVHAIVANPLETMESDRVTAVLHPRTGAPIAAPPDLAKDRFAAWLLDEVDRLAAAIS